MILIDDMPDKKPDPSKTDTTSVDGPQHQAATLGERVKKSRAPKVPSIGPLLTYRSALADKWKPREQETLHEYLVRIHKQNHDVSKERVARGAGIKRASYSQIYWDRVKPSLRSLQAIARAWGLPEHYFTRFYNEPDSSPSVGLIVRSDRLLHSFMGVETDEATFEWVKQTLQLVSDTMDRWKAYQEQREALERSRRETSPEDNTESAFSTRSDSPDDEWVEPDDERQATGNGAMSGD